MASGCGAAVHVATEVLILVNGPQLPFPIVVVRLGEDSAAKSPRLGPTNWRWMLPSFTTPVAVLGNADVAASRERGGRLACEQSGPVKPQSHTQVGVEAAETTDQSVFLVGSRTPL